MAPANRPTLAEAKEEAKRALERRANQRTSVIRESPSPAKGKGKGKAKGPGAGAVARGNGGGGGAAASSKPSTRRSSSARSKAAAPMDVSEGEEEEEEVDGRMLVDDEQAEKEEEAAEPPQKRRSSGRGVSAAAALAPSASKKRPKPSGSGGDGGPSSSYPTSARAKKARQGGGEEEEDESQPPLMAKPRDIGISPYTDEGYVDERFYNPTSASSAPASAPSSAPSEATVPSSPSATAEQTDPYSFVSNFAFWRRRGGPSTLAGGTSPIASPKRVAFRENLEEEIPEDVPSRPPSVSPMIPPLPILRQRPAASSAAAAARRGSSSPPSRRQSSSSTTSLPTPTKEKICDHIAVERFDFRLMLQRLKKIAIYLAVGILVFISVYGGCRMLLREKCPPGQVREQFVGLFGDCVVSSATIRRLMKEVQKSTVIEICSKPSGAEMMESLDHPPDFAVAEVWQNIEIDPYPWELLQQRGLAEYEARGHSVHVRLQGRAQVLQALWSCWAFQCRLKVWLYENWPVMVLAVLCLCLALWILVSSRARGKERREVERVKREIIEILRVEGEMPPEHARDEILHRLDRDYSHLALSATSLKKLWPKVVKAVEKESRVAKSNIERYGRGLVHWKWIGSTSSRINGGHGSGGGSGAATSGSVGAKGARGGGEDDVIRARLI